MIEKYKKFIILAILIFAGLVRLYGLNWDQGYHLHPDERAIVLKVVEMKFPTSLSDALSPESSWNPKFFAYGSFPFYLLRITGDIAGFLLHPLFSFYDGINLVGRFFSAFFDVATVIILYYLGKRFFHLNIGLIAAFLYAISTLPIQLSHFYAVDTILTFFTLVTLYYLLRFYDSKTKKDLLFSGSFFGLALASKISAIVLFIPFATTFLLLFLTQNSRNKNKRQLTIPDFFIFICVFLIGAEVTFLLAEPYALLDAKRFISDTLAQSEMTKDAFTFPYTLQYVGKIPFIYELKNIFFFGLGIPLALLAYLGVGFALFKLSAKHEKHRATLLILFSFFIPYFFIVCNFKVGFMRYMLPLYPLFSLFAAFFLYNTHRYLIKKFNNKILGICYILLVTLLLVWPLSFLQIYTELNTRVTATDWIQKNIPIGRTIAIEHWDDSLPLIGQHNYKIVTLPLYEPDTEGKWEEINGNLANTDYIILASNRLYVPLMKLTDCKNLPENKCYRETTRYYNKLFSGSGDFVKIKEFSVSPRVPLINIPLYDQMADESFTVYDHPKIMIFKRR